MRAAPGRRAFPGRGCAGSGCGGRGRAGRRVRKSTDLPGIAAAAASALHPAGGAPSRPSGPAPPPGRAAASLPSNRHGPGGTARAAGLRRSARSAERRGLPAFRGFARCAAGTGGRSGGEGRQARAAPARAPSSRWPAPWRREADGWRVRRGRRRRDGAGGGQWDVSLRQAPVRRPRRAIERHPPLPLHRRAGRGVPPRRCRRLRFPAADPESDRGPCRHSSHAAPQHSHTCPRSILLPRPSDASEVFFRKPVFDGRRVSSGPAACNGFRLQSPCV